ncbi:microtubule-associated protein 2 isoform X2 [Oncorhynchus kisutch]|uniref:microtubule-associated protein 2 isoform X2 n=1 Tax=Oncorhynchus kisutch TaxID=8019 RepID=UPI0012DDD324|nr:microtubule-associated protein 2 isoform X2 [Oncorhynchus kisutch]
MADSRQREDTPPQWDPSGAQDPSPPPAHGANGYPPSYRACQPGTAHGAAPPSYTARENGFNGDHAVTAEQVSARIVQEVTAEAVAVLKGEQETRLPSVEDTANLPPSPPPSPAAEHCFGPLDQDVGDEEEEACPLHHFQNSRERCKFLAPSISVSMPEDDPYHSDEEYYDHPLFSPEWDRSVSSRPSVPAAAFRQIQETVEALTDTFEEEEEEEEEVLMLEEEMEGAAAEIAAALEELWSGDEPELDSPPAEPLEQAEAIGEAHTVPPIQAEAASAAPEGPNGRVEEEEVAEAEGEEESPEEALKMDTDKPDSERSGSLSPDFTEQESPAFLSRDHTAAPLITKTDMASPSPSLSPLPSNSQSQAKELSKMSILDEPKTVSEKQPSVEVLESSNLTTDSGSGFTTAGGQGQGQGVPTDSNKDKSGMSAYFETSALKPDEGSKGVQAEGYYELSTAGEEKKVLGSSSPTVPSPLEINYSMLAQTQSVEEKSDTMGDQKETLPALDRSNECRLSPGKLALDQRSYSLNITIGSMDPSGHGRPRNFSPLATDIMSFTSGSLEESANYLPVTTPSVEKEPPPFRPLILETAASVTSDSSSPPHNTATETPSEKTSPQGSESPESPFPPKYYYKNGTVMAPDLPEMLDLAGSRSRLASENTDPEIMRRKSVPVDAQVLGSDSLANLVLGDQSQNQSLAKSESQLEELGYCVFSEYSGPMPSPADLHSPIDSPPQRFTPMALEEKMAEEKLKIDARDKLAEDEKTSQLAESAGSKEKEETKQMGQKDSASEEKDNKKISHENASMENQKDKPASALKSAESFVTPTVTVTLEEEGKLGDNGPETDAEMAAYERQIRRLEMEDRPLSMEEERELQELREKVKDKFLVHQEAYEEVDAEDVYQLTGVAKDRISRPVRPSPASSVESTTEEDNVSVMETEKPKQMEGQTTPKKVDIMVMSPSVSVGGSSTTEEDTVLVTETEKPKQTGGQTTPTKLDVMATSPSLSGDGVSTTEEDTVPVMETEKPKQNGGQTTPTKVDIMVTSPSVSGDGVSTTEEDTVPVMETEKPKQNGGQTTPTKVDIMVTSPSVSGDGVSTTEEDKISVTETEKPKQTGGQTTPTKLDVMVTSPSVSGDGVSTTEEDKIPVLEIEKPKQTGVQTTPTKVDIMVTSPSVSGDGVSTTEEDKISVTETEKPKQTGGQTTPTKLDVMVTSPSVSGDGVSTTEEDKVPVTEIEKPKQNGGQTTPTKVDIMVTSPSVSGDGVSTTEEDKVPVTEIEKPKQNGGQTTPTKVDIMVTSPSVSGDGVSTTEEEKVSVTEIEKPKQMGGQTTPTKIDPMTTSPSVSGSGVSATEDDDEKVSKEELKEQVVEVKERTMEENKKVEGEKEDTEQAVEPDEIMIKIKPSMPVEKEEKVEKDRMTNKEEEEEEDSEVLAGAGAALIDVPEPRAAIESVVTVEDDFITVVQTIDEGEEPGHSVRFSAPPEPETPEEEEEESQEVEIMEAASLEEVGDVSEEVLEKEVQASREKEVQLETEGQTESYDRDETTMDDSILDSSWVDTQDLSTVDVDDDMSMAAEQIEPLRADRVPAPPVKKYKTLQQQKQEKQPVKPKAKSARVRGREGCVSTPERKPVRKETVCIPREDIKKKKAVNKKTELTKKAETRSSPSRKSVLKPTAVRHPSPAQPQPHPSARRKPTVGVPEGRRPLSVARQSRDRASSPPLTKIPTCKTRVVALLPPRPNSSCSSHTKKNLLGEVELDRPRPSSGGPRDSTTLPRLIYLDGGSQSPKRSSLPRPASVPRPASILSRRTHHQPHDQEESSTSITSSGSTAPRRPTSFSTEVRAEHRTGRAPSWTGTQSMRSRSLCTTTRTPGSTAISPGTPPSYSYSCRTPGTPLTPGTPRSRSLLQEKKVALLRTPPKSPATTPKQLRILNQPLPDLKNIKSKIGSTDNIKYQPKGGQQHRGRGQTATTTEPKRSPSWIWRLLLRLVSLSLYLSAAHSVTWAPMPAKDQLIQILNKKLDFSHVQSKCGSKDNMKHSPRGGHVLIPSVKLDFSHVQSRCGSLDKRQYAAGGGNVQIQTKKIDLSHVTSKCGSLDNIRHRPGGGNVRIESVKLDFKDKAQPKIESHKLLFRDMAKARVDHGAEIIVTQSPEMGMSGTVSPHRDSHLSSSGSINLLESPQLATLAEDVTAALAKQGL